ncbi:uncharacterized protein LOC122657971 [Telopea speciosissima]|uniref:uncharacterized protein LOC122657971 n=1 Tax=Telopea speciosissima TaxID=54955 RepID=UPI001CC41B71|nr:uncharacterized protein LOC122657971 [Telopea speciosissima]
MAFAQSLVAVPLDSSNLLKSSISPSLTSSSTNYTTCTATSSLVSHVFSPSTFLRAKAKARKMSVFSRFRRLGHRARAKLQEPEANLAADAFTNFRHVLLPITDRNPYLSEGTRQAAATIAALAKKYGADITVAVIDEKPKESLTEHDTQLTSIRWHLSEGGFQEFRLIERLGEGNKPTAIIGEVADDLNLDLVVMSMEAIHSKHIDANLLAEFIPCPVILLPL